MSFKQVYGSMDRDNPVANYMSSFVSHRGSITAPETEAGVSTVVDLSNSVKAVDNVIRVFVKDSAASAAAVSVSLYEKVPSEVSATPVYKLVGSAVSGLSSLDEAEFTGLYGGTSYKVVLTTVPAGTWEIFVSNTF